VQSWFVSGWLDWKRAGGLTIPLIRLYTWIKLATGSYAADSATLRMPVTSLDLASRTQSRRVP
jgi:hypothetical protein